MHFTLFDVHLAAFSHLDCTSEVIRMFRMLLECSLNIRIALEIHLEYSDFIRIDFECPCQEILKNASIFCFFTEETKYTCIFKYFATWRIQLSMSRNA